jgi:hypothetical protein
MEDMMSKKQNVPLPVKILSVSLFLFGLLAFFGPLFLWGEGFILDFPEGVSLSSPVADILVHTPTAIIASIGLWKLTRWGYIVSQFVAGFYIYVSVEILTHVVQYGPPYAPEIYAPQILAVLIALGLVFYLWRVQSLFQV